MLTEEQVKEIQEMATEGVNTWIKKLLYGPIMVELINGQTDLFMLRMRGALGENEKRNVRKVVQETMKTEIVKMLANTMPK